MGRCEGLIQHPVHFYKIMQTYFGDSIFLSWNEKELNGYVFGFRSQRDPDIFFLWQIGVLEEFRGTGLAVELVEKLVRKAEEVGSGRMHVTAEIDNIASWKLFLKCGFKNISSENTTEKYGQKAIVDYYGSGTDQVLLEKVLIN